MRKTFFKALLFAVSELSFSNYAKASPKLSTWAEQRCSFAISMDDSSSRFLSSRQKVLCVVDAINAAGTSSEVTGCIATLLNTSDPVYNPPIPTVLINAAEDVISHGRCTTGTVIELLFSRPIDRAGGLPLLMVFKYTSAASHNRNTRIIVDKIGATNAVARSAALFGTILSQSSHVSD
ncbi:hypothetical protein ACNH6C_09895 [Bdellovibrio bacteriovorus]|uniref:hypothetical protein n=1 Tax=Bdellovibrio bacteriovorus TaxID=959 RepID=UPI003A80085F